MATTTSTHRITCLIFMTVLLTHWGLAAVTSRQPCRHLLIADVQYWPGMLHNTSTHVHVERQVFEKLGIMWKIGGTWRKLVHAQNIAQNVRILLASQATRCVLGHRHANLIEHLRYSLASESAEKCVTYERWRRVNTDERL